MKIRKISMFVIGVVVLLISSMTASAASDGTADIWHYHVSEATWGWGEYSGEDKSNIDITSVDYSITGSQATLTMTVNGNIEDSETVFYYMHIHHQQLFYLLFLVFTFFWIFFQKVTNVEIKQNIFSFQLFHQYLFLYQTFYLKLVKEVLKVLPLIFGFI